jgi:hypothetical protein
MKFTRGYELIYEKNGKFYGSNVRIPTEADTELSVTRKDLEGQGYKLVYVKNDALLGAKGRVPAEDDTVIVSVAEEVAPAAVTEEAPTQPTPKKTRSKASTEPTEPEVPAELEVTAEPEA